MSNIYDQHDKAFNRVSAYVIARNGERVATIAFRFPADGAGRLYAYVHWIGLEMVRGMAGGYGYDKRSAACANAMRKLLEIYSDNKEDDTPDTRARAEFIRALARDGGQTWDSMLRDAGFTVWQAV